MKKQLVERRIPMPSRQDILDLYAQGLGTKEISVRLEICESWARRVKQEFREQGKTENATTREKEPAWAPLEPRIQEIIAAKPDITLLELQQQLQTELHTGTLCRALHQLKLTFKKKY